MVDILKFALNMKGRHLHFSSNNDGRNRFVMNLGQVQALLFQIALDHRHQPNIHLIWRQHAMLATAGYLNQALLQNLCALAIEISDDN